MRLTNYVISYPRSGWHWFTLRGGIFLRECLQYRFHPGNQEGVLQGIHKNYPGRPLANTHFGFNPMDAAPNELHPSRNEIGISSSHNFDILLLLRGAAGVLNSHWHLYNNRPESRNWKLPPMEQFILSERGISKYCDYLNRVHQLFQYWDISPECYYYENMFEVDSIKNIPQILGIDYEVSDEEAADVFQKSSMASVKSGQNKHIAPSDANSLTSTYRTGKLYDYKKYITPELCDYVDDYLQKNCLLPSYRNQYLGEY